VTTIQPFVVAEPLWRHRLTLSVSHALMRGCCCQNNKKQRPRAR